MSLLKSPALMTTFSFGNPYVLEDQLAGRHAPEAQELLLLPEGEAGRALLHEEAADALVARRLAEAGIDHVVAGMAAAGDEDLPAVQDVGVPVLHGLRG
jgi:hypothetical protein